MSRYIRHFFKQLADAFWRGDTRPTRYGLLLLALIQAPFLIFLLPAFINPNSLGGFPVNTWGYGWVLFILLEFWALSGMPPRWMQYVSRGLSVVLSAGWMFILLQSTGFPVAWSAITLAAVWSLARTNLNED